MENIKELQRLSNERKGKLSKVKKILKKIKELTFQKNKISKDIEQIDHKINTEYKKQHDEKN